MNITFLIKALLPFPCRGCPYRDAAASKLSWARPKAAPTIPKPADICSPASYAHM